MTTTPEQNDPPGGANKRALLLIAVVVVSAVAAYAFWSRKPAASSHGGGGAGHHDDINARDEALKALYDAPVGATNCETSWNALDAFRKRSDELGLPPAVEHFPDRETYLQVCNEVPPSDQECLIPKYEAAHTDGCRPILQRIWAPHDAGGKPTFASILPTPARSAHDHAHAPPLPSPSASR